MKLGIDAAKKAGGVCEAVVCYSGDVANPKKTKYTLKYYMDFVDQLVGEGIHVLGIKDMAGLLKPEAAKMYEHGLTLLLRLTLSDLVQVDRLHQEEVPRPTNSRPLPRHSRYCGFQYVGSSSSRC